MYLWNRLFAETSFLFLFFWLASYRKLSLDANPIEVHNSFSILIYLFGRDGWDVFRWKPLTVLCCIFPITLSFFLRVYGSLTWITACCPETKMHNFHLYALLMVKEMSRVIGRVSSTLFWSILLQTDGPLLIFGTTTREPRQFPTCTHGTIKRS